MKKGRIIRKGLRWSRIPRNLRDIPNKPGVYVLFYGGEPAYIGETADLNRRITAHSGQQQFSEFSWYQTTPQYRFELERRLIRKHRPPRVREYTDY